jgi:hypothetical protein
MFTECRLAPIEGTVGIIVQILTVEIAVDLGSGLLCGKAILPCLWPVTDVFQLKSTRVYWV